jgi:hypothetical protein
VDGGLTAAALRRARAAAQLLGPRADRSPEDVVGGLLAVQAQDLRAARLALRARATGFGASDVDAALEDGRLVRAWLLRGTLHLVRAEDFGWLWSLCGQRNRAASARRLGQLGVTPEQADRAVHVIAGALDEAGTLTRAQLAERLAAEGIPVEGQATPHLLGRAAMDGVCVMCGEQRFRRAPSPVPEIDRDEALERLGRRYLAAHAPAEAADLAAWSGLPVRDARRALDLAGPPPDAEPPAGPLPPRLLGMFDEYLLGWRDRSFAVPEQHAKLVHPGGGMLRAVAIDDGLVVGDWDAGPTDEHDDVVRFLTT